VTLEVLYKPPRTHFNFHKDLDNLMQLILPSFNAIFQPPINPLLIMDRQTLPPELIRHVDQLHLQIPASIRYSVVGYDILEITRDSADTGPGYISIGIASGTEGGRLWNRLDELFERVEELDD
jgi:hypothetical protein